MNTNKAHIGDVMNTKLILSRKTWLMKCFWFLFAAQMAFFTGSATAYTVNSSVSASNFEKQPSIISDSATPLVMLVMSNDHQLYFKLYTDWDDLDSDGTPETTYKHSVDYYGYFDSYKCYDYDVSDGRFEPKGVTADKYCNGVSGNFSGNFMNWASMTRIDALRKVFYGGYRSTDSTTVTVLERSFLPTDAHSFAKHYEAADISKLTPWNVTELTLCNTTYTNNGGSGGVSQNVTAPPLIRVAQGDFRYWAANERWQCTWDNERGDNASGTNVTGSNTSDPSRAADGLGQDDYIARVQACVSGLNGKENCKAYDDNGTTRYKPIGLLQTYGETGAVDFGLLTGSYQKNKSGGVVRKDVSSFTAEVNTSTGQFTGATGIVETLDRMRISRYGYSDNGIYNNQDSCAWGLSSFTEGNCSNWGNPISEMYLEAVRYFAGKNKNSAFNANDSGYINGLTSVSSWTDPLSDANRCASCNIVVINASDISYDFESLSMSDLPGAPSATTLTNTVGTKEGISGNSYFVGEDGTAPDDQLCTAKTITNLGDVQGTCPNAPRLDGTYNIAGISHWAHTEDIRTDINDIQLINTYSVALAPSTPSVVIPVPNSTNTVTLLPACRNTSLNPDGNCAIVDFKIIAQNIAAGTGTLYVNWEDSEQGGDYDQDMQGTIEYSIAGGNITITTDVRGTSTGFAMGFGYVINGTTNDGFHVHSGIYNFYYDEAGTTVDCNPACTDNEPPFGGGGDPATARTYTIGTSSAKLLNDPLWYAAKYGGFNDSDNDKDPNEITNAEWDLRDTSGNANPDGIPDNYFPVFNPSELEDRMNQVFNAILNRVAAGTAAAVVSNSATGVGAVYQAIYQPLIKVGTAETTWAGFLHSIFIDKKGLFREDSDGDGVLDDYTATGDRIIDIYYDTTTDATMIQRYTSADGGLSKTVDGAPVPIHEINPIWSAHEVMSTISNTMIKTNRVYTPSNTTNGRYMFTWIDDPSGAGSSTAGEVDIGEVIAFEASQFDNSTTNFHFLNTTSPDDGIDDGDDAGDVVNFVRGVTGITNQRNREIDYDNDSTVEKLRIGDLIHSTPAAVGAPNDNYETIYGDDTYRDFVNQYANRRQVVYVGGNDGVIHAFNSGFWDETNTAFVTDLTGTAPSPLPLGAELWGYVPMNLLPQLKWLPNLDYQHVYYMDGEPLVVDAKIFSADNDHPNGWGTVLIMGMRLGGGDIALDINGDNTIGGTDDTTVRSAYVVIDITNPEVPPTVIAEITDANLKYTTSKPSVVKIRKPVSGDFNTGTNDWYLAFGSGPDNLVSVESSQTARIYLWDMSSKAFVTNFDGSANGSANGFVSDMTTIDWDLDAVDDVVYFGTDETNTAVPAGRLQRLVLNDTGMASSSISTMINAGQALLNKPLTVRDGTTRWVFTGSGRLFTSADINTTSQESFYGIRDDLSSLFTLSNLQDVTGVDVYTSGAIDDTGSVLSGEPVVTDASGYGWLENTIGGKDGWYFNFTAGSGPSDRTLGNPVSISRLLLYTIYTPTSDLCNAVGNTDLRITCMRTGTACPFDVLGTTTTAYGELAEDQVDFAVGLVTDISIHMDSEGNPSVIGQGEHGELNKQGFSLPPVSTGRQTWREITDY
ncbi:MAG: hypothetical protein BMS9Abin26_1139 [Gammaproteobacteria bacterium]|nr:MAG: hypothetical protein BMS9Abin26_1139 [Gammaproteobacteria bacterium]